MTAATTTAGSCSQLISVMSPLSATFDPATILAPPALTLPAVTTTSAETSLSSTSASLVVSTTLTRSTSRTPSPGVNASAPVPDVGEIEMTPSPRQ